MSDPAQVTTAPQEVPFKELFDRIERLKEIDIAGIEPMLPPAWTEEDLR